jgi:hypothetical protein
VAGGRDRDRQRDRRHARRAARGTAPTQDHGVARATGAGAGRPGACAPG